MVIPIFSEYSERPRVSCRQAWFPQPIISDIDIVGRPKSPRDKR